MLDTEETSDVIVHNTPVIDLSDEVIPCQSQIAVKGSGIHLKLRKKLEKWWDKLSSSKYSWIRVDFDAGHDDITVGKVTSKETEPQNNDISTSQSVQCEFNVELDSDDSSNSSDEEGEYDNYEEGWKNSMYL